MYARVEKPKDNKNRAVTNYAVQNKSDIKKRFNVDKRSETKAQRKMELESVFCKSLEVHLQAVQRKIYIGKGVTEPIQKDGEIANELRAEAKLPPYPVYMVNAILNPAIEEWEKPVRVENKKDVLPFLMTENRGDDLVKSFKEGDKLYGMEKARKFYTYARRGQGVNTRHPTVDDMNKALGVGSGKIISDKGFDEETRRYGIGLAERRPDLSSKDSNVNFKEACKKAIEYITMETDGTIHFELDQLDIAAVVTKKLDSITGAELRKIFRELVREEWADEHSQKRRRRLRLDKIKFYMRGRLVPPPWIQEPELWAKYREHRRRVRDQHFG